MGSFKKRCLLSIDTNSKGLRPHIYINICLPLPSRRCLQKSRKSRGPAARTPSTCLWSHKAIDVKHTRIITEGERVGRNADQSCRTHTPSQIVPKHDGSTCIVPEIKTKFIMLAVIFQNTGLVVAKCFASPVVRQVLNRKQTRKD